MPKQMKYANAKGFQFVVMIGSDELKDGKATVKNMFTGDQFAVLQRDLCNFIIEKNVRIMIQIENRNYSIKEIGDLISSGNSIQLSSELVAAVQKGRSFLEDFIQRADRPIYGINTGFGSLCDVEIGTKDLGRLQENLVKSHACGTRSSRF